MHELIVMCREEKKLVDHMAIIENVINSSGMTCLGFRDVPVDLNVLGEKAQYIMRYMINNIPILCSQKITTLIRYESFFLCMSIPMYLYLCFEYV